MLLAAGLIDRLLGQFGYAAVFAFVCIESLGVPFPGETMLIAAALYAGATHQLTIVPIIAAAAAGAVVGDNLGYAAGYFGGYRFLIRYGRYLRLHDGRVKLARYLFRRHGGKVVFFGRFVSVLRTYAALLAGTARMPWTRFLFCNATGGIVWAAVYGGGAFLVGDRISRLSGPVDAVLAVVAVVVIAAVMATLRHKEGSLTLRAESMFPGPLERP